MSGNSNSYICVDLPNHVKDTLYNYSTEVGMKYQAFKIMDKQLLHMTFIYLGPNKKYKELCQKNADVQAFNNNDKNLEFKSIHPELFPPVKQKLLIVKFKTSDNVNLIRKNIMSQLKISECEDYIPHVTLGKFVGKKQKISLQELSRINFVSESLILNNPFMI